jgi:hypothetical protein
MANIKFKNFDLKVESIKNVKLEGQKLSIEMNSGNIFSGEYESIEESKQIYLDLEKQKDEAIKEQMKSYNDFPGAVNRK